MSYGYRGKLDSITTTGLVDAAHIEIDPAIAEKAGSLE